MYDIKAQHAHIHSEAQLEHLHKSVGMLRVLCSPLRWGRKKEARTAHAPLSHFPAVQAEPQQELLHFRINSEHNQEAIGSIIVNSQGKFSQSNQQGVGTKHSCQRIFMRFEASNEPMQRLVSCQHMTGPVIMWSTRHPTTPGCSRRSTTYYRRMREWLRFTMYAMIPGLAQWSCTRTCQFRTKHSLLPKSISMWYEANTVRNCITRVKLNGLSKEERHAAVDLQIRDIDLFAYVLTAETNSIWNVF